MTAPTTRYEGGCHCGAVRFRADVEDHLAIDCNCSMCARLGYLHVIVPPERFAILRGEDELTVYTFNTHVAKHMFCRRCGVHPFYRPRSHPHDWDVNALCLDGDAASKFRVETFDGQDWEGNVASIRDRRA